MLFVVSAGASAQRRSRSSRAADKKSEKSSSSKKDRKREEASARSKNSRKDSKKDRESARSRNDRRDSKKDRESARDNRRGKSSRDDRRERASKEDKEPVSKKDKRSRREEARKAEIARRKAEEERRQAILAEQRRRAEAARIARERAIAFQRGLRTETEENIAKDNTDGEDLRVRAAAINALGSKAGTVVVMEAQTGKVLTIVNQDWAIRNAYRPCSTIKLVTGVAGLTEHVINEEGGVGNSTSGMSLETALARSNNQYFQHVGSYLGSSRMVSYARKLGLGEQTGINADGEASGRVPNGNNSLKIYSHGDDFELSPLQLAVLASEISNGGKRVVPQVPKSNIQNTNFRPQIKDRVDVPEQNLEGVIPGMIGAAEWGTAHKGVDASLGIAGKTGSCITRGTWIGLFTSVAPVENPKYAIAVITRGASERGKYAAAVAGRVYQALAPQIRPARNVALADARFKTKSRMKAIDRRASDEDEDDDDTTANNGTNSTDDAAAANAAAVPAPKVMVPQYRQPTVQQPVQKPLVTRTVQSQPKNFAPVVITYKKDADDDSVESKPTNQNPTQNPASAQRPRVVKNK